ncbi:Lupus La protein like protein B [Melipona quadrifasciata]|uniref:Lupus La protein like protein B n=1 Tax=Melipona quadrifasciata TaxID=166423 RepID=A0A0N0BDQ6_9HYME|nr:Lupus La protein like protein B [Melipona quadrifasciata]
MRKDEFLIRYTKLDNGWIPMTTMLRFRMLASMSQNVNVILKALESSDLMEISQDKKKIRRPNHPLPVYNAEYRKAEEARTIHVDSTIDKLLTFFDAYKPFDSITVNGDSRIKGSAFVLFKTLQDAKAFMGRESVKYGDTELIRVWSSS